MTISRTSDTFERWTKSSIECFERRCKCGGCSLEEFCARQKKDMFYRVKPMKYAVLVLFSKFGKPKERENYGFETNGNDSY